MMSTIYYERGRIFTRRTIVIFSLLVIASLYFTFLGVAEYKSFLESKIDFIAAEKSKINFYLTYEQYGATGFRVIFEPSPLSVFFNRYDFTRDIEATIDTSEIIKIYNGRKGKKAFSIDGRFGDLNYSITIFGTLIMMIMGFLSFPNKFHIEYFDKRHYIRTIFARILLLDLFFVSLPVIVYGFARGSGITFLPNENRCFVGYGATALLLLDIFFLIGLIIKALCKYKRNALNFVMITWFIFIFAIPELGKVYRSIKASQLPSVEKLEMEKLKTLLNSEVIYRQCFHDFLSKQHADMKPESPELKKIIKELYQNYLDNGYKLNQKKEGDLLRKVKADIDIFSFLEALFPVDFINYISAEISGKGKKEYLDFLCYVIDLKDRFMQFYGQKRYDPAAEKMPIESFIKDFENIYRSRGRLPENFPTGMGIMVIYIAILSGLARWLNREKKSTVVPPEIPGNIKQGHILFLLVNKNLQEEIVYALKQGKRSYLHRKSHCIMNEEVTAKRFIDYACREKKIDKTKVMENLELFDFQKNDLHNKLLMYSEESKQKIICSLVFAEANEIIIIDDFIKGVSAEFEKQFLELATREAKNDRRIVYIGSEIYTPTSSLIKLDMNIKNYHPFQLEPQQVSLR